MIVSHEHEFIFLKTRKTAGTSIEIALSQVCGPNDLITPIEQQDEAIRRDAGSRGPQNYMVPFRSYGRQDWKVLLKTRKRLRYYNHMEAQRAKRYLGKGVWNRYFKFSFERNPFDKALSLYWWLSRNTSEPPSIPEFLASVSASRLSNWRIYTIDNRVAVDFMGRYENLTEDLRIVAHTVGIGSTLPLPHAKAKSRKDQRHYSEVLCQQSRARIERVCAREMAVFGYRYEDASEEESA